MTGLIISSTSLRRRANPVSMEEERGERDGRRDGGGTERRMKRGKIGGVKMNEGWRNMRWRRKKRWRDRGK